MRFDACASEYDSYATPQRTFAERVAGFIGDCSVGGHESGRAQPAPRPDSIDSSTRAIDSHLAKGISILELGAGTGALTRCLCRIAGARVCATDASPAMVKIGRSAVPTAEWITLDAFHSVIPPGELQVSSGLLQWASDPVAVLRHWQAALRPGGRMVHAFACEPCLREWRQVAPESPVTWRAEAGWMKIFEEAGLSVRRKQIWLETIELESSLALARSLHGSGVTGRPRLSTGQLREAMRQYDRLFRSEKGVFSTWAWMAVEATRA
jgi:SAM-dependent methyltransferase